MKVINKINIYIYVLIIVIFPYSVYMYTINWRIIEIALLIITLITLTLNLSKRKVSIVEFLLVEGLFVFMWLIFILYKGNEALRYFNIFVIFPISTYVFIQIYTLKKILKVMGNVILIYCIVNLVFYLGFSILKIKLPSNMYMLASNGWIYKSFYNLYYEVQYINTTYGEVARNSGIFNEPSVNALIFNLGLICEMYFKRNNTLKKIIFTIGILTTTSTSGIIILIILVIMKDIDMILKIKNSPIVIITIIIAIISVASILEKKSMTGSYNNRMEDYSIGLKVGMKSPVLGLTMKNAYNEIRFLQNEYRRGKDNLGGVSNIYMQIFVNMGFLGFIWYFFGLLNWLVFSNYKKKIKISIIVFLSLAAHSYSGMYFIWINIFVFYGYVLALRRWGNGKNIKCYNSSI